MRDKLPLPERLRSRCLALNPETQLGEKPGIRGAGGYSQARGGGHTKGCMQASLASMPRTHSPNKDQHKVLSLGSERA